MAPAESFLFEVQFEQADDVLVRLDRSRTRVPTLRTGGKPASFRDIGAIEDRPKVEPEVEPTHEPPETPPPPAITEVEHEEALSRAREEAVAETEERLTRAFESAVQARRAEALEAIAGQLEAAGSSMQDAAAAGIADAIETGYSIARAMVPKAIESAPLADVEVMLQELLPRLHAQPNLRLALAPDHVDEAKDSLAGLWGRAGLAGDLAIEGDPDLRPGEARLSWENGVARRDLGWLEAELRERLEQHGPAPEPRSGADRAGTDADSADEEPQP